MVDSDPADTEEKVVDPTIIREDGSRRGLIRKEEGQKGEESSGGTIVILKGSTSSSNSSKSSNSRLIKHQRVHASKIVSGGAPIHLREEGGEGKKGEAVVQLVDRDLHQAYKSPLNRLSNAQLALLYQRYGGASGVEGRNDSATALTETPIPAASPQSSLPDSSAASGEPQNTSQYSQHETARLQFIKRLHRLIAAREQRRRLLRPIQLTNVNIYPNSVGAESGLGTATPVSILVDTYPGRRKGAEGEVKGTPIVVSDDSDDPAEETEAVGGRNVTGGQRQRVYSQKTQLANESGVAGPAARNGTEEGVGLRQLADGVEELLNSTAGTSRNGTAGNRKEDAVELLLPLLLADASSNDTSTTTGAGPEEQSGGKNHGGVYFRFQGPNNPRDTAEPDTSKKAIANRHRNRKI